MDIVVAKCGTSISLAVTLSPSQRKVHLVPTSSLSGVLEKLNCRHDGACHSLLCYNCCSPRQYAILVMPN